jgi:hypothetical protein
MTTVRCGASRRGRQYGEGLVELRWQGTRVPGREPLDSIASRLEVPPAKNALCAECGDALGDEVVAYRQDPDDPQTLLKHFSGIVKAGPVEPKPIRSTRAARDFRYPDDLDVFFL